MTTELKQLVGRLWRRAYLDSEEEAGRQINEYAKKHAIECMNWRDENIYPLASESISNEQIYQRFLKEGK